MSTGVFAFTKKVDDHADQSLVVPILSKDRNKYCVRKASRPMGLFVSVFYIAAVFAVLHSFSQAPKVKALISRARTLQCTNPCCVCLTSWPSMTKCCPTNPSGRGNVCWRMKSSHQWRAGWCSPATHKPPPSECRGKVVVYCFIVSNSYDLKGMTIHEIIML